MPRARFSFDWELVARQYDEMVKYATALRLGTADAEAILRRFTRENIQHPTYKALSELGKAVKTAFLARYLADPALRREIASLSDFGLCPGCRPNRLPRALAAAMPEWMRSCISSRSNWPSHLIGRKTANVILLRKPSFERHKWS